MEKSARYRGDQKNCLADLPDTHDIHHLRDALQYIPRFRTAIDIGAHRGIWTREMARHFARVYAFEPVVENFEHLPREEKVIAHNVAIGDARYMCSMRPGRENTGQWHVRHGETSLVVPLDEFKIQDVDFIKIDVEGYELRVLHGARETIKRERPAILLEENGLCKRYGVHREDIWNEMHDLGYQETKRWNKDYLFTLRLS